MRKIMLFAALATTGAAHADDAQIKAKLAPFGVTNMEITDAPIAGLKTVVSDQGIFYASPDGSYFLQGSLVHLKPDGSAEDLSTKLLMNKLEAMKDKMIVFPAKNQKHVISVFTDITCPYCLKLHRDMKGYNDRGITVRYLAFPRAGANSKVAQQMETIWQSDNPQAAFDAAEKGKKPELTNPPKIVRQQFQLGEQFGVRGTPAIITDTGELIPGYIEPDELAKMLDK